MYKINNKKEFCEGFEPISREFVTYNNAMSNSVNKPNNCKSCRYYTYKNCNKTVTNYENGFSILG